MTKTLEDENVTVELLQKKLRPKVYVIDFDGDMTASDVKKLREKIGDNYIKTLKGVGYMFDAEQE